jgi:cellulose synthase/poly-beta-1,6-N-acetylglucosamine synthase-like glycosyltransferase
VRLGDGTGATPTISVVVPSVGRPTSLAACLEGLRQQTRQATEVIAVLRHGDEASGLVVARAGLPGRIVTAPSGGFVAALLAGAAAATSDAIAFLDDDAVPVPGWIEGLAAHLHDPTVGGVGGRIRNVVDGVVSGSPIHRGPIARITWYGRTVSRLWDHPTTRIIEEVDFLPGSNMCFRLQVVQNVRPALDYGMAPGNELEFAFAAKRLGLRVVYDSALVVNHYPMPRGAGPRRGDAAAYCRDYGRCVAFVMAGWLSWPRLLVFALYFALFGQRVSPGPLGALFLYYREPSRAVTLMGVAIREKLRGLRDGLRSRRRRAVTQYSVPAR